MVEVTQVRVKWDGTGAQNEQEATVGVGWGRSFGPGRTGSGSMIRFNPPITIEFRISVGRGVGGSR